MPRWIWRVWPLTRLAALLDERDTLRLMNDVRVNRLSADDRHGWVMELSHHVVPLIGDALAKQFEDCGGQNYVEFTCKSAKLGMLTLTLQRCAGKTPHELRLEAERERDALTLRLAELEGG